LVGADHEHNGYTKLRKMWREERRRVDEMQEWADKDSYAKVDLQMQK
jgi:hypothetical protein